jgi:hypothetical protein
MVILALLLTAPALSTGLVADDLFHELMLRPDPGIQGIVHRPFDLFAFATGDAAANHQLMDEGVFPWWADPTVALSFWRPLTCFTHLLDHWLWAQSTVLMHLQSLVWFALVLLGVACVYRRLLVPPWVAGLALLLYAVDDARAPAVAWVANRNALVSMALATPALVFHDRWRRNSDRRARWLGPVMLALGLLGGETAFAVAGYLVAYAACLDRGQVRERLLSLVPYALVVLAWRLLYAWTGHGVAGSGVYLDLARDPVGFVYAAAVRLPLLLSAALVGPWADLWEPLGLWAPGLKPWVLGWSVLVVALVAFVVLPVAKKDPVTRFFAVGCVLASIPMCSTFVHDRLLMVPCLGSMAVVACVLASWIEAPRSRLLGKGPSKGPSYPPLASAAGPSPSALTRLVRTAVVGVLAVVHLIVGPLLAPVRAYAAVGESGPLLKHAYDSIPSDAGIAQRTVVLVNPPFDPFASYFPLSRQAEKRPRPEHLRWLATGATPLRIERTDEQTLLIEAKRGWLSTTSERMLRNPDTAPAQVGDVVNLSDVSFEVTHVIDRRPHAIRVRFGMPLGDSRLLWLQWDRDTRGYIPFLPPPVGSSVEVDPVDMWQALAPLSGRARGGPTIAGPAKGDPAHP